MKPYADWCSREAATITDSMRSDAMAGIFSRVAWFIPASGEQWARVVLAFEKPDGATDVLRWRVAGVGLTSSLAAVPYSAVASQLYESCQRLPVYPVALTA